MSRLLTGLAMGLLVAAASGQATAADWGVQPDPVFKPAYPVDMMPQEDSLDFEAGIRYFYGMGGQSFNLGGTNYSANDTSHALEVHGRIDDHSTSTYVKGHIGYGAITDGEFAPNGGDYNTGRVGYINADFGYLPLDTGSVKAGVFGGYMYADESPEGSGPIVHGLRLGVAGQAEFNNIFDISAEAAIIPYASVTGSFRNGGTPVTTLSNVNGSLYGAAGEVMAGFHVTENFIIRGGARATYLNGYVTSDQPGEQYVESFRWGPVVELTASF
ncbi:hypothetical protein V6617_12360 [Pelagibacterium nitratireducens]|uniref:Uncharacterized protein n=1 Tax=Pelagibacterium nitratireducens TaxID=1046114 RepID=A0ABZ2HVZ6_9HYPH